MRLRGFWFYFSCLKLLLSAVSFCIASHAVAATFSASMADAKWHLKASVFECSLSHPIALYGSATFAHRAGETEVFRLRQNKQLLPEGDAQLQAVLPSWSSEHAPMSLGPVKVGTGVEAIRLDAPRARQLQTALEEGRRLIFMRRTPSMEEAIRVVLEPIHFRAGIEAYRKCIADLLPVNFDQVARTAVYFPDTVDAPPANELRKLDVLIRYVKADTRVNKIYIDGHTDSLGVRPENLEVSKGRAELIANYRIERGVPEANLVTRWHGERYPVASNKTARARALNRRVTLRLERKEA